MGERTRYESGTFSWADLATTDQDAAKDFYAGLFGWEYDDQPIGAGAVYTMCSGSIGARLVNAPGALSWNEAATTDVETAKQFYADLFGWTYQELDTDGPLTYWVIMNGDRSNGKVLMPTTPLPQGAFNVIADPQGAAFALYEGHFDD
jgi:predicted enzyme related to lactoylglutathione lyase